MDVQSRRMAANAIRMLAVDAIEQAQSGHPGMPMGMADIAATLWLDFCVMRRNVDWPNRDRFVVSWPWFDVVVCVVAPRRLWCVARRLKTVSAA